MDQKNILVEGKNCFRKCKTNRVAFLIDGAAYFAAFAGALARAKKSILIAGWDIDSRLELFRDEPAANHSRRLGDLLNEVVARRSGLHAHILVWDFAMIYAFDREPLPFFNLGWKTHRRVHFHADDEHPIGASHHQKIVVVDDKIAFVGGLDLTKNRWDTPEHRLDDPRRLDSEGVPYSPFHDLQMMVDGEAATCLGELVRERWRRATGKRIAAPIVHDADPWPADVAIDLHDAEIAIARTEPAYKARPEVCEVENLYKDAIAFAERFIYIENQYLTSLAIAEALAARFREKNGPEAVLVLPRNCAGWLEEQTMDNIRALHLQKLKRADTHDRLRVYYPSITGNGESAIMAHAKVLIVDDRFVRIGSSNLSNRSMGLDTECDLALEAGGDPKVEEAIRHLRHRLLGEHLGVAPEKVAGLVAEENSLIKAVETLRGGNRTLFPLHAQPMKWITALDQDELLTLDPEKPVEFDQMIEAMIPEVENEHEKKWRLIKLAVVVLLLAGLAAFWYFTPLGQRLDEQTLSDWAVSFREEPAAPLYVLATYIIGGLIMFPITLLIGATAAVFEPMQVLVYALAGTLANALVIYGIGRVVGREPVRRLAGGKLNRLSQRLAKRGLLAVTIVQFVPIAPFSITNLVAGASHIRLRDFALGTLLGIAPGIIAVAFFMDRLRSALVNPNFINLLILIIVVVLFILGSVWITRRSKKKP